MISSRKKQRLRSLLLPPQPPLGAVERRERTLRFWQTMLSNYRYDDDDGDDDAELRRATLRLFDSAASVDGVIRAVDAAPTCYVIDKLRTPIGEYARARVRASDVVSVAFNLVAAPTVDADVGDNEKGADSSDGSKV